MLRVGVPAMIDPALHALLPQEVEVVVLREPSAAAEVDFWIVPPLEDVARAMWANLRGVRVAQSTLAGVDWLLRLVDGKATVCDARGVHDISTAEWAVAATLAALKNFPLYRDIQHEGKWAERMRAPKNYAQLHHDERRHFPPIMLDELHGKRVLIVGYGAIGSKIEQLMTPFGVVFDRVARSAKPGVASIRALPDLLSQADVVVLIVPLTEETRGLISERELAAMKQGALLVNAARGPVVETDALIAALRAGKICAALDVTDPEPLPDGHPLWSAPNVLITPHIGGASPQFMRRAMQLAAEQLGRMLRNEPLENIVTGAY